MNRRHELGLLAALLTVYAVTRGLILRGWNRRIDTEEMSFGALPAHLGDGLVLPLLDYQTQWREGGSILMAPVLAGVMAVLGDSFLAIKAGGVVWYALVLLAWWLLTRLSFGAPAALVLAALLAFAPPFMTTMQFTVLAAHGEAQLFPALALCCAVGARRRPGAALVLGAGFLAGLGWSFAYSAGPLGACALAWLAWRGPGPRARRCALITLGLLGGLAPWLAYFALEVDLDHGPHSGVRTPLEFLLGVGSGFFREGGLWRGIGDFVSVHLFSMWGWPDADGHYDNPRNGLFGAAILLLAAGSAVAVRAARPPTDTVGRELALLMLAYSGGYALLAVLTGARLSPSVFDGYRYLLPLQFALLTLAAGTLGALASHLRPRPGRLAWVGVLLLLALPASTLLERALTDRPVSPLWDLRGYTLQTLREELADDRALRHTLLTTRPRAAQELSALEGFHGVDPEIPGALPPCPEGADCPVVIEGAGRRIAWALQGDRIEPEELRRWLALVPDRARPHLLRGLGRGLRFEAEVRPVWAEAEDAFVDALPAAQQALVAEGIGIQDVLGNDFHFGRALGAGPQPEAYARGTGRALARLVLDPEDPPRLTRLPARFRVILDDPAWRQAVRVGYRAELARLVAGR